MSHSNPNTGIGVGFWSLLFLLFFVLKLERAVDWSWLVVTAPLWGGLTFIVVTFILTSDGE